MSIININHSHAPSNFSQKSAVFGGGFRFDGPKKRQSLGEWVLPSCYQLLGGVGFSWSVSKRMDFRYSSSCLPIRFTISLGKFVEGHCFGSNQAPWNTHFSSSWAESTQWVADDFGFEKSLPIQGGNKHIIPSSLRHPSYHWVISTQDECQQSCYLFSAGTGTHIRSRIQPLLFPISIVWPNFVHQQYETLMKIMIL